MELVENIHYERIVADAQTFVRIGDEECYVYLAANGRLGLIRRTHPEAYSDNMLEVGEEWRAKDMAAIKNSRRRKRLEVKGDSL